MVAEIYYLVRSQTNGQYLVAHLPRSPSNAPPHSGYILLFREHAEALTYLNMHGNDIADRFAVESLPATQLETLLKRWNFTGIGIVQDPLLPKVEFLSR